MDDPTIKTIYKLGSAAGKTLSKLISDFHDITLDKTGSHIVADNVTLTAAMIGLSSAMAMIIADLHRQSGKKISDDDFEKKWHAAQESVTYFLNDFMAKNMDGIPKAFSLVVEPEKKEPS